MNTHIPQQHQWWLARIIIIIILILIAYGISHIAESPKLNTPQEKAFSVVTRSEKTDFYTLEVTYPNDPLDRDGIITTWAESIINTTREDWKTGGALQQSEADLAKQFPDRGIMKYDLTMDYTKHESNKLGTVSYVMEHYEFTGGAHGNTGLKIFNFNQSGSIGLCDVVSLTDTNYTELAQLIRTHLSENLGEMADERMIRDGLDCAYLAGTDTQTCDRAALVQNLQNFYITDTGITFVFGQYQVAAYAVGMPEVTLSWSELALFMNPEFDVPLD